MIGFSLVRLTWARLGCIDVGDGVKGEGRGIRRGGGTTHRYSITLAPNMRSGTFCL